MKFRKVLGVLFVLSLLSFGYAVNAQQTDPNMEELTKDAPKVQVDDEELSTFVKAADKVSTITRETQKKMEEVIKGEGLEPERFVEIYKYRQNPKLEPSNEINDKEKASFDEATQKVETIQKNAEKQQIEAIKSEGMEVKRYVRIARAVQQDQDLQNRIREMINGK